MYNFQDRCSVQEDMDMSESEASDEDWVATDTEPDTDTTPSKNWNHKSTIRSAIIPSETQGKMLRLLAAPAPDSSLHCTCGRASLCKTSKCKCRSNGAVCGTSCGCLSKKCTNRADPPASIYENEVKRGSDLHQNLASEGAMLLQSAFTEKTEDGCDTRRRMPLSDIGNTMKKSNLSRPNRRRKVWKKSSIKLVQVPEGSGAEKRGDGDGTGKQETNVEEEEEVGEVKFPHTLRSAAVAETSRPLREKNATEAAAAAAASHTGCTEAKENRGSSNV